MYYFYCKKKSEESHDCSSFEFNSIVNFLLNIKNGLSLSKFLGYKPIVALYEHKKKIRKFPDLSLGNL